MLLNSQQQLRALNILSNMALEKKGWKSFFSRWHISDEPLRHDAARLLRDVGWTSFLPDGTDRVE